MKSGHVLVSRCLIPMLALGLAAGCAGDEEPGPGDGPPPGYVRYEADPVTVEPGQNGQWLHWVAEPADVERSIVDIVGAQGTGGHHAILYTSADLQPVGTTRVFENADQSDLQFVGGVGGEGGDSLKLPPGVVFRVPAGRALVIQSHFLNATDAPVVGTSRVDVKFAEPSADDIVARFFAQSTGRLEVPPALSQRDAICVLPKDLPMLMFANHMHEMGTSIATTITAPGGAPQMIRDDPSWQDEYTFNPVFTRATPDQPIVLAAGSTLTTHCEWNNTGSETLSQPDEMCVFFGFFLGERDAACGDGHWRE